MARHFGLDLDRVESLPALSIPVLLNYKEGGTHLSIVYADNAADHFGDDDHVAEVSFDDGRFLVRGSLFFSFAEFLDEAHWTALEAAVELAACTRMDELEKKVGGMTLCNYDRTYVDELRQGS